MIRPAERKDIPQLIELGMEFGLASQAQHGFPVDRARVIEFTNEVVENPDFVVLVSVSGDAIQGVAAGAMARVFFSNMLVLQELVWYAKSGKEGIALFKQFLVEGKNKGVSRIVVGHKPQYCDLRRVYERYGFSCFEHQYMKEV